MDENDKIITCSEPYSQYSDDFIYSRESYRIIGACFEVHKELGKGFNEVVYKDALEQEFHLNKIPFTREKKYGIVYKDIVLNRTYICDFILYDKIVLEVKAQSTIANDNLKQLLNYLAATKCSLGLLVNFGEDRVKYRRIVL